MIAMSAEVTPMPACSSSKAPAASRAPSPTLHGIAPGRAPLQTIRELPGIALEARDGARPRAARRLARPLRGSLRGASSVRFGGMPVEATAVRAQAEGSFVSGDASLASPWAAPPSQPPTNLVPRGSNLVLRAVAWLTGASAAVAIAAELAPLVTG